MYHIGVWRQCAAGAKISLCQLVNKWEREDDGQIRVLISFHQLWMPAELKVNIWGFSKPSRCLESMDWLALAAPLSVFVAGQGQFQMCHNRVWANSYLDKNPLYIILCTSFPPTALFFILPFFPHRWSRYSMSQCGLCHALQHMVRVICDDLGNVCRETSKGGLLFMITWKTIVALLLAGRFAIFFLFFFFSFQEQMQSEALQWGKLLFFDCKLENINMRGGKYRRWKHASFQ